MNDRNDPSEIESVTGIHPRCDICGRAQQPEDDWNGETGNHRACEPQTYDEQQYADLAARRAAYLAADPIGAPAVIARHEPGLRLPHGQHEPDPDNCPDCNAEQQLIGPPQ